MVVAASDRELRLGSVADSLGNHLRRAKVEYGALDRTQFAGRDQTLIDRRIRVRFNGEARAQSVGGSGACKTPIAMVGQVENGRRGGGCGVLDLELIVVRERVGEIHPELARVALITVRAHQRKPQGGPIDGICSLDGPDLAVEPLLAAMLGVGRSVPLELVPLAAHTESSLRDPVGVAPDRRTEVFAPVQILQGGIVTKHDVAEMPERVAHHQLAERRSEREDCGLGSPCVGKPAFDDLGPRRERARDPPGYGDAAWGLSLQGGCRPTSRAARARSSRHPTPAAACSPARGYRPARAARLPRRSRVGA